MENQTEKENETEPGERGLSWSQKKPEPQEEIIFTPQGGLEYLHLKYDSPGLKVLRV